MGYGHLNIDEREVILKMQAQPIGMRRSVSTILRHFFS